MKAKRFISGFLIVIVLNSAGALSSIVPAFAANTAHSFGGVEFDIHPEELSRPMLSMETIVLYPTDLTAGKTVSFSKPVELCGADYQPIKTLNANTNININDNSYIRLLSFPNTGFYIYNGEFNFRFFLVRYDNSFLIIYNSEDIPWEMKTDNVKPSAAEVARVIIDELKKSVVFPSNTLNEPVIPTDYIFDYQSGETPTNEELLSIAKKYDSDAFYILDNAMNSKQHDVVQLWYRHYDQENFLSAFATAVHEEVHHYFAEKNQEQNNQVFLGNGEKLYLALPGTPHALVTEPVFKTEEMSAQIPQTLRTFRFDIYISKGNTTDSNQNGAYGLIDELCAYYIGSKTAVSLENSYIRDVEGSLAFYEIFNEGSLFGAYYEFKFWFLRYFLYAQQHYPDTFDSLMSDKDLIGAYVILENRYKELISRFTPDSSLTNIINEMSKPEYVALEKKMEEAYQRAKPDIINVLNNITSPDYPATANALDTAAPWAKEAIENALKKGFVPSDIQSEYSKIITRAEFCRMAIKWLEYATGKDIDIVLAEKGLTRSTNIFTDTNDPDILAAFALAITNGTSATTFTPDGQISREQAATMLMNTCSAIGADVTGTPTSDFVDLGTASVWAVDGINFVRANGIMGGTSTDPSRPTFSPKGTYTRQESIVTFDRIKLFEGDFDVSS